MFQRILMGMNGLLAGENASATETSKSVLNAVTTYITAILGSIIGVAAMVAVVYAIVVGAKMARANNAEEREEAKKKVIFTVAGIGVAIAIMIIMFVVKAKIPEWIGVEVPGGDAFIGL